MNSASLEVFFVRKELIPACKCLPGEDRQRENQHRGKGDTGRDSGTYDPVRRDE